METEKEEKEKRSPVCVMPANPHLINVPLYLFKTSGYCINTC